MQLRQLLKHFPCTLYGSKTGRITGISDDSRAVAPGYLFCALRGVHTDGHDKIDEAIAAGAQFICSEEYRPWIQIPQLIVPNTTAIAPQLASLYYQQPTKKLWTVGVTGTDGKTTTSYLIHALYTLCSGQKSGLISTIGHMTGLKRYEAHNTTPGPFLLQKLAQETCRSGGTALVVETSSHALALNRVDCIDYNVGVFTNLGQDHLDFHKTQEAYAAAKAQLFSRLGTSEGCASILNCDDAAYPIMAHHSCAPIITFGTDPQAHWQLQKIEEGGRCFHFIYAGKAYTVHWQWLGRHNVMNALAALAACAQHQSFHVERACKALGTLSPPPGRLEKVDAIRPIYVDFAHTPQALTIALQTLANAYPSKPITVVFGCGGERDASKRPAMGEAASIYATSIILTADNSRSEPTDTILHAIAQGCSKTPKCIPDRYEAIAYALKNTQDGVVLIAGRGCEPFLTIGTQSIPFLDRDVVHDIVRTQQ